MNNINVEYSHIPVLKNEIIKYLNIKNNGIYFDCTLGAGGHTKAVLEHNNNIKVIGVDTDINAIQLAQQNIQQYNNCVTYINDNYKNFLNIIKKLNIEKIDGALLDLGVSSMQIDNPNRGFSYLYDNSVLDMRMDNIHNNLTAIDVLNKYEYYDLANIIYKYGDEIRSYKIAKEIIQERNKNKIIYVKQLKDIIYKCYKPTKETIESCCKKTFQAIRIEVNKELQDLDITLKNIIMHLNKDARLAVISFHSLEDKIVKDTFNNLARQCVCNIDVPVCICGCNNKIVNIITKKPIVPSVEEIILNKRSSSAKLRIVEKI